MDKNKVLIVAGVVGVVAGTVALVIAGQGSGVIVPIVEATAVLVGLIIALLGAKKSASK